MPHDIQCTSNFLKQYHFGLDPQPKSSLGQVRQKISSLAVPIYSQYKYPYLSDVASLRVGMFV